MFASFDSVAYWGACPRSCTGRNGKNACECTAFALGGPMETFSGLDESPAADTPSRESLASRLGQFCVCSAASTRNLIRTLRTGEKSGIEVLKGLAGLASDGAVTVAVSGDDLLIDGDRQDVSDSRERAAFELLEFYANIADLPEDELSTSLCSGLSVLQGSSTFILHDRKRHRVVASRMADGCDLFWGLTPDGNLLFSSTMDSAIDQCTAYQIFPADALFISSVEDAYEVFVKNACPGRLVAFARSVSALPRSRAQASAESAGGNAALCRIASGTDLAMITSSRGWMLRTPSYAENLGAGHMASAR